jgi:sodium/hydrogen exchanger 8
MMGLESESAAGAFSFLLLLVALVVWVGHLVRQSKIAFLTQGSLSLIAGLIAGGGAYLYFEYVKHSHIPAGLVAFKYDIYMHLLLPPIIFYAGFSIKKKDFFANFVALSVLGIGGTVISAGWLAAAASWCLRSVKLETHPDTVFGTALALGTIFSSSDSVAALQALNAAHQPQLQALVFGEGIVNDATAIVLLRAVQHVRSEAQLSGEALGSLALIVILQASCSMALGTAIGLGSAWILKHSFLERHSTDHEVSLLAVLGFLSYLVAERVGLSGVFSAFFCGLTMSHYAWHSLSPSAKVVSVYAFRVLSFLAELVLFMACGLDLWSTSLWHKEIYTKQRLMRQIAMLAAILSVACIVVRFLVSIPLLIVVNLGHRPIDRLSRPDILALTWAGCARGAVTLALAVNHFVGDYAAGRQASMENQAICVACMVAVVGSTVFLGGLTPYVLNFILERKQQGCRDDYHDCHDYHPLPPSTSQGQNLATRIKINVPRPSGERDEDQRNTKGVVHKAWVHFDRTMLQPIFGGRSQALYRSPPPSPGRWNGASSAIRVLQRETPNIMLPKPQGVSVAPCRPSPFADYRNQRIEEDAESDSLGINRLGTKGKSTMEGKSFYYNYLVLCSILINSRSQLMALLQ